jgi:hypothetical protein
MKFVKCFFVSDVGVIYNKWVNESHIKSIDFDSVKLRVFDSKGQKETMFESVISFKSDSEFPGYIDVSKPIETKTIEEAVQLKEIEAVVTKRLGRPPKNDAFSGQKR